MGTQDRVQATGDEAWELARELVRIDSSDPGAYEGQIERFIKGWLEERIARLPAALKDRVSIEELEALPGRTELMATIPGTGDEPRLVYICHMDTVTLGDGWDADIDPLGGLIRDDRLYGRGACDMKSGLASALVAFATQLERTAQTGELPHRGFSIICSVDEEDFMRGVERAIETGWVGSREWVLDTEPTDGQLQIAHKGRTWFEVTMAGVTAHASQPWKGADAIAAMAECVSRIRTAILAQPAHDEPPALCYSSVWL
ncbi:M20/M25/M40 family metallo-hydrolase, partial [Parolsenella catena]|uniref:M20/M25/M40 family metallo-hydrolase n=1 Tax=Parolsenella catena TaxID=2003188 RepID=UPI0030786845